jgi:hypothetical protein
LLPKQIEYVTLGKPSMFNNDILECCVPSCVRIDNILHKSSVRRSTFQHFGKTKRWLRRHRLRTYAPVKGYAEYSGYEVIDRDVNFSTKDDHLSRLLEFQKEYHEAICKSMRIPSKFFT